MSAATRSKPGVVQRVSLTLIFTAVSYAVTAADGPPATAAASRFDSIQHNIQYINHGAIRDQVTSYPPLTVSAQEVCSSEWAQLRSFFVARGYTIHRHISLSSAANCPDASALYEIVATLGDATIDTPGNFPSQAPGTQQVRGYTCIRATYGVAWVACSTHLEGRAAYASYAEDQAEFMRGVAFYYNATVIPIVGGDFNLRPSNFRMSQWYGSFNEADQAYRYTWNVVDPPRYTLPADETKVDYIWAIQLRTDGVFDAATILCGLPATGSDHCFYRGYFYFIT